MRPGQFEMEFNVCLKICFHAGYVNKFTSDSIGGSPPASSNRTFQFSFSLSRLATTDPALPAPTTMKSYSSRPKI